MRILVLNGPNINMLGIREPELYGRGTYAELVALIEAQGARLGVEVRCEQTNSESRLIDLVQQAYGVFDGIVINPAGYTHTSIALADAVKAVGVPTVEVHLTDPDEREPYRCVSYIRSACIGTVKGEGFGGYLRAMELLLEHSGKTRNG